MGLKDNYKAIAFDFDGTLVESIEMKTEAFKELFSEYPDSWDEIKEYHLQNEGISREVKVPYIYKNFLRAPLSVEKEKEMVESYSDLVYEQMLSIPLVSGADEIITAERGSRKHFIASGTPDWELKQIFDKRDLTRFFDGVYGAPSSKEEIVRNFSSEWGIPMEEMLFVGDAQSDYEASRVCGMDFVWRKRPYDAKEIKSDGQDIITVKDMTELSEMLRR
ncbi:HAD family hydrolase [Candidatus Marinimicrobia bacterium MT.SAG.3]|nr:HAD family hydrolase [Candidatus Marinimicrobia bacterium MT.SAG.3]